MMESPDEFLAAVRAGNLERVKSMLAAQPELIRSRRDGASAVLIARYHGRHDVVAFLRSALPGLDIFEAAALGDRERVARLLDGTPGLANAVADDGFGPLGLAAFFDHEPVVRLLLERHARVDAAFDLLLAYGADPTLRDDSGLTAADHARQNGHVTLANRLR